MRPAPLLPLPWHIGFSVGLMQPFRAAYKHVVYFLIISDRHLFQHSIRHLSEHKHSSFLNLSCSVSSFTISTDFGSNMTASFNSKTSTNPFSRLATLPNTLASHHFIDIMNEVIGYNCRIPQSVDTPKIFHRIMPNWPKRLYNNRKGGTLQWS